MNDLFRVLSILCFLCAVLVVPLTLGMMARHERLADDFKLITIVLIAGWVAFHKLSKV